jgi:hypothetical protein
MNTAVSQNAKHRNDIAWIKSSGKSFHVEFRLTVDRVTDA